ncbi:MAG: cytochrome P450 [Gaiellaceae bacterium]
MSTNANEIPGPAGDGAAGNLASFTADPLHFLQSARRQYGDVVRIGRRNVLVADPSDVKDVLTNRTGSFCKIGDVERRTTRGSGFPRAMMNSDGRDWRLKRPRLQPVFAAARVQAFAPRIVERTGGVVDGWPEGEALPVCADLRRLALELIVEYLFGPTAKINDGAVDRSVSAVMAVTASALSLPRWLPAPSNARLWAAKRSLRRSINQLAAKRHQTPLSHALAGTDPLYAHDEIATLLMSGHETTADALGWVVDLLSRAPEVQDRLAEEATGTDLSETNDPSALPYASAVVRECLRLWPPAWITNRETLRPLCLGGYSVPDGTTVAVSQWVTHRHERIYEDPDAFRPERWLAGRQSPGLGYFPFGAGPRVCIGARLAMTELVLITAELARRVIIEPVAAARPRVALALQPVGLQISVRHRFRSAP